MDRIGILIELLGDKQALKSLTQMETVKKRLSNEKIEMRFDINNIRRQIRALEKERDKLYQNRKGTIFGSENFEKISQRIRQINAELKELYGQRKDLYIDIDYNTQAIRAINSEINGIKSNAMSLRDVLSGAGTWFSAIGSGLQSIGSIFNTDILSYVTQTLTQLATSGVMNNLDKAATRWDTLSTYAPYMEAVGISAERAYASLNEVDQVIQGLPIGLDEAALDIRRTSMLLGGDLETATKFVEGFDQALIAGGAPQQMRNWSYIEMQRLLTSGKLNQSRQWMSLVQGLGVAVPYLKNAMGYGDLTQAQFEANLFEGSYTGEEVIKGFAAMADDPELQRLIEIYKGTIESGMSNLHYALARGLQKTFDAFNEVGLEMTGMGISDYLMSGRNFIDRAFEGIADWVRDNPDTITGILDQIEGLAKRAERFDWGKLAHSIIGSIQSIVDIATWIYDHVPEPVLRGFLTFSMVWATPLGKGFSALGNLFTTLAYLPFPQIGKLTRGMGNMGRFVGSLKTVGQGFLGASAYIGIIAEIGLVIYELTKVAEVVAKADLEGFWKNFGKIAGFGGILTGLGTALTAIFSAISAIPGGALVVGAGELLSAGFVGLIAEIGAVVYEFTKVAEEISTANLPSSTKITRVFSIIQSIASGITDVDLRLGTRMRTNAISRMIGMLEGLSDALPALQNIADADIDATKLESSVKSVLGAYKAIDDAIASSLGEFENRTNMRITSWQDAHIVENITAVIEDIGATIDALGGIEDKLNEYGFFNSVNGGENQSLTRIGDTLETVITMMTEVSDIVTQKKGVIGTLATQIKSGMEDEIIKHYNDAMQSIADLITTIQSNRDTFNSIMTGHGHNRTLDPGFTAIKENIKTMLDAVSNGKDGILDGIYQSVTSIGKRMEEQDFDGIANIVEDMNSALTNVASIFETIQANAEKMQWIGQAHHGAGESTFAGTIANLNTLIDSIADLHIEKLNGLSTNSIDTNTNALFNSVEKIINIAQKLNEWNATLVAINTEGGAVYNFKKMLNDLMTALSGDGGTISAANYTAMAGAIKTLQESLEGVANVNLGGVIGDIKDLGGKLKDLAQKAKDGAKYLNELRDKMIAAANIATNNASKYSTYISSLSSVATQALRAYDNVSSLVNALNAVSDKTINITVNTSGLDEAILGLRSLNALSSAASGVNRAVNAVSSLFRASGGKVNYLAKGGMPMKPRGTDTVPAMLTPGEWVINRRASRAFGDNFMRKINAMDIPGAMDALMKRSKWTPSGGVYYTTNNYNNQSVTQNFSRERDSKTSYRRANRYLGAL